MPADFSFQLYPDDLERLEWYLDDAVRRVPILGTAGLSKIINGPIPYAPDGNPLLGPMPGVPNAFEACVFTFGIAQAGGAGKVLAEWVTEGRDRMGHVVLRPAPLHVSFAAATRTMRLPRGWKSTATSTPSISRATPGPRRGNRKLSPLHDRLAALGAQFNAYNGWERATWYAQDGDDTSEAFDADLPPRSGPWEKRIREECLAVRDAAGILDLPGFSALSISTGPKCAPRMAFETQDHRRTVPKVGRIGFVLLRRRERPHRHRDVGHVRHSDDLMTLITAAVAQLARLRVAAEAHHACKAPPSLWIDRDRGVFGPDPRLAPSPGESWSEVCEADLSRPLGCRTSRDDHRRALVPSWCACPLPASSAGRSTQRSPTRPPMFDALWAAGQKHGLKPFGMFALDALRLEKGYRAWKQATCRATTPSCRVASNAS
jgi:dimethylglycine dehydrogenase